MWAPCWPAPVLYGVLLGLLVGKPLGIMLMSFIVVKLKVASLPENVNWFHMLGAGVLGGVGFTMSIFVANLAFADEALVSTAKLGILVASLLAGVLGFVLLMAQAKVAQKRGVAYLSGSSDDVTRQTAGGEAARDTQELLRELEDPSVLGEIEAAKKRGGVFEIVVDLGESGLLGGGSIGDVREAVRDEVVRVLREEGRDDLADKAQEEFREHAGEPPLASVEEVLRRERPELLKDALEREADDATGMSGDDGKRR